MQDGPKKKIADISESSLSKKQDLVKCKFCNAKLTSMDIEEAVRQPLEEKWGIWGGVEYPYIQLYNVKCPTRECGKKYTVKLRKSTWIYK
jgi:hypothetical protein